MEIRIKQREKRRSVGMGYVRLLGLTTIPRGFRSFYRFPATSEEAAVLELDIGGSEISTGGDSSFSDLESGLGICFV